MQQAPISMPQGVVELTTLVNSAIIAHQGRPTFLADLLLAMCMPSAPNRVEAIAVPTTAIRLCLNDSQPFMRITVTNDDPAQPIWIAARDVLVANGEVLRPRDQRPYVLPKGADIWAVCAVGTVSARVSYGYDFVGRTRINTGG